MTVSLCMIVKDEEEVLSRCLDSVKALADELIIVDTGSTDGTKAIAKRYTENVYSYEWRDDFAAARNYSFSLATGDYLLWLDADDVILPGQAEKFPALRRLLDGNPDAVRCPYDSFSCTSYRERFLRREAGFLWQGRVHECVSPHGRVIDSDLRITHLGSKKPRGARNLRIYQKWAAEEPLDSRNLFYYGRELYYQKLYTEACAVLEEMLRGEGWYVNKIEACKIFALCCLKQHKKEKALTALFQSFLYGEPRAAVLTEIGGIFYRDGRFKEAAFWYEGALTCRNHAAEGDFEEPLKRTLTPLLQLTCIYYKLGDPTRAVACHRRAETLAPDHPSVRYNRAFFTQKGLISPQ